MISNPLCHEKNIILIEDRKMIKAFWSHMVKFLYLRSLLPGGNNEEICGFDEWW